MYHLCNVNGCDIYVNMMVGSIVGEEEILLAVLEEYTVQNSQWSTMNFLERWYNSSVDFLTVRLSGGKDVCSLMRYERTPEMML